MPSLLEAVAVILKTGAKGITMHLREDRRHIQDSDLFAVRQVSSYLNMEMALTDEMLNIAKLVRPNHCCLVPEKRAELTTEDGLNLANNFLKVKSSIKQLNQAGIEVSLFIDPEIEQVRLAKEADAQIVELHTGSFANSRKESDLEKLKQASLYANEIGLIVHLGHGIDYENISEIIQIPKVADLNIGFSIIAKSLFVGLEKAVILMQQKIKNYAA